MARLGSWDIDAVAVEWFDINALKDASGWVDRDVVPFSSAPPPPPPTPPSSRVQGVIKPPKVSGAGGRYIDPCDLPEPVRISLELDVECPPEKVEALSITIVEEPEKPFSPDPVPTPRRLRVEEEIEVDEGFEELRVRVEEPKVETEIVFVGVPVVVEKKKVKKKKKAIVLASKPSSWAAPVQAKDVYETFALPIPIVEPETLWVPEEEAAIIEAPPPKPNRAPLWIALALGVGIGIMVGIYLARPKIEPEVPQPKKRFSKPSAKPSTRRKRKRRA